MSSHSVYSSIIIYCLLLTFPDSFIEEKPAFLSFLRARVRLQFYITDARQHVCLINPSWLMTSPWVGSAQLREGLASTYFSLTWLRALHIIPFAHTVSFGLTPKTPGKQLYRSVSISEKGEQKL